MKVHVGITIDKDFYLRIEEGRGLTKRSTFMEFLLRLGFEAYEDLGKRKKP
jgi:hypothetical protein